MSDAEKIVVWLEKRMAELLQNAMNAEHPYVMDANLDRHHYYGDVVRGIKEGVWRDEE